MELVDRKCYFNNFNLRDLIIGHFFPSCQTNTPVQVWAINGWVYVIGYLIVVSFVALGMMKRIAHISVGFCRDSGGGVISRTLDSAELVRNWKTRWVKKMAKSAALLNQANDCGSVSCLAFFTAIGKQNIWRKLEFSPFYNRFSRGIELEKFENWPANKRPWSCSWCSFGDRLRLVCWFPPSKLKSNEPKWSRYGIKCVLYFSSPSFFLWSFSSLPVLGETITVSLRIVSKSKYR